LKQEKCMPHQDYHTQSEIATQLEQLTSQQWDQLVLTQLPADMEAQARQLKAFQRARSLPSASALLRGLLCYVLTQLSLRELSVWSLLAQRNTQGLSHQAWHAHLIKAASWLQWLFNALLTQISIQRSFPGHRLLLIDATHLPTLGRKGITWRLHTGYDLLTGCIAAMKVTDLHTAEGLTQLPVGKGDIVVADGAYSRACQLIVTALDHLVDFAVRWSPAHLTLYAPLAPDARPEHRVEVHKWLAQLSVGIHERQAMVIDANRRLPVRIVALVPTPEQAARLREKKSKEARDKGRKLSAEALYLAGFLLIVTTLPAPLWPAKQLIELYRCRWQIEVLFKRIKQVLARHQLPCKKPETAQAMIFALLIGWLLVEDQTEELRRNLADGDPFAQEADAVSSWQLASLCFQALRQVVEGWWDLTRLRQVMPQVHRECKEQRARPLREHERRATHLQRLVGCQSLDPFFCCSSA
jgi:hypothetical protein